MVLREGEMVGGYRVLEQLGQGGMATVYKAYHEQLDRHVAIKVMHQNFLEDESFLMRFRREAQIVARLEHPNIISVYDYNEHQGQPYLVMKYVEGETLKRTLSRGAPSLDEVLHVMTSVGSALTYAHEKGVLHRDIKPSNIIIDSSNTPYLADFGLARIAQAGESTMSADMLLGTPHYISPEQAKGIKNLDGRADLYSLGVVLYELLVGRVPYTADTPYAIVHDHIYAPLPLPSAVNPDIPETVEGVLLKSLAKDPNDRYQTANEMVADLRSAIRESNLTELNPDRASVASVSIAKMRENTANQHQTPVLSTPSPASYPEGYTSAAVYKVPSRGRWWMIGGLATFLVISFIFIGVLLSIWDNLLQIRELGANAQINPAQDLESELSLLRFASSSIPLDLAQEAVDNNTDDFTQYLVVARANWADNQIEEGIRVIRQGLPFAPDRVIYHLAASQIAESVDQPNAAVTYALIALLDAQQQPHQQLNDVREIAGAFLYESALEMPSLESPELRQALEEAAGEQADEIQRSAIYKILQARNRLENELVLLAAQALRNIPQDVSMPEALLVRGELLIEQGQTDRALQTFETAKDIPDSPKWLQDRVDELIQQIEEE